jgi:hypothetical protein
MITAITENMISLVKTVNIQKGRESESHLSSNLIAPARKSLPLNQANR